MSETWKNLRNSFFAGLLVVVPVAASLLILITMLSGRKTMFQRVVLVEFPRPGVYSIGFVTSETAGETQVKTKEEVINVFVPTTPNPTSGFLILVPRQQLIDLKMTVAEGMKLVISGGTVVPPYPPAPSLIAGPAPK